MLATTTRPSRKMLTASTRPVTVIRASGGPDVGEDGHVQVPTVPAGQLVPAQLWGQGRGPRLHPFGTDRSW
jgi:hypothetical protein